MESSFEYLRPPKEALQIQKNTEQIYKMEKSFFGSQSIQRFTFFNVPLLPQEETAFQKINTIISNKKILLPKWWKAGDTLRTLFFSGYNIEKSTLKLGKVYNYFKDIGNWTVTPEMAALIRTGALYVTCRDNKYRPILVLDLNKADLNNLDHKLALKCFVYFIKTVREYMLIPYYVEQFIMIIDFANKNVYPLREFIFNLLMELSFFDGHCDGIYVVNISLLMRTAFNTLKSFISGEAVKRVSLLSSFEDLAKIVPKDYLEKKFTGNLPDVQEFWPIAYRCQNPLTLRDLSQANIEPFETKVLEESKLQDNIQPQSKSVIGKQPIFDNNLQSDFLLRSNTTIPGRKKIFGRPNANQADPILSRVTISSANSRVGNNPALELNYHPVGTENGVQGNQNFISQRRFNKDETNFQGNQHRGSELQQNQAVYVKNNDASVPRWMSYFFCLHRDQLYRVRFNECQFSLS